MRDQYGQKNGMKYFAPVKGRKIRTLSLFSGAGGLDVGFASAGFDIVACVEINPSYAATLRLNEHRLGAASAPQILCEDIRKFDPTPYKDTDIECVIGGPPCQTFSAAGRRSGGVLGTDDARGQLFRSYCDILAVLRPKVFVFENVYGLPGANGGGPWREITSAFSHLGYSLRAEVLDAADYGVPQHRERLIMVGYLRGEADEFYFPWPTHGPDAVNGADFVTARQAIEDLQDPAEPCHDNLGGRYGHLLPLVPEGLNYSFFTAEMGYPKPVFAWRSKFHDLLYKVDPNAPSRTIKAQPGKFTGPFHWKNRHFTEHELKRLQTFPDDYQFAGGTNKMIEQIGNSVPPLLSYVIAVSVREQLLEARVPLTYRRRPAQFRSSFRQRQRERTFHFKKVARAEIQRRFPSEPECSRPADESYFASYSDRFSVRYSANAPRVDNGEAHFGVECRDLPGNLMLSVKRVDCETNVRVAIAIEGLSKYLGRIDALSVEASTSSLADIFAVWSAVERALVSKSEFFTLIDIYGHYANRGDTVVVTATTRTRAFHRGTVKALNFFGRSENCGTFFRIPELCEQLGVAPVEFDRVVREMRSFRFDLRTKATHPTIACDDVICTYPFPLLSERAHLERRVRTVDELRETA